MSLRILYVEDHQDTALLCTRMLTTWGHAVSVANTLAGARALATQHTFDLLLCDIGLPDGSGNDLMRELTRSRPIRGIALTGFGMGDEIQQALQAGFHQHILKPIDLAELKSAIDSESARHTTP